MNKDMLMSMDNKPIILAMANPVPEVIPELVSACWPDAIIGSVANSNSAT